ncbi:MAG: TonB-dependent receptor [Thalassotalea sp.]
MMKTNLKRTFKRSVAAIAVTTILGMNTAFADTGALKIQILDASGKPVAGAQVAVHTPESLTKRSAMTDENGFVRLSGLDPSRKYEVDVNANGFSGLHQKNVKVESGKSYNLNYTVNKDSVETIEVRGTRNVAQVDVTSSTVGLDITLDLTESLPTGRNYQSYLQLAPGTKPSASGNPSSKGGVNYADSGGSVGTSSDNVYYLDGVNVTDNDTGTFGANINSEIIQEQQILTGGIPAEFEGGTGLVTRVVTKSGGNEFSGSFNYYTQNDSLVADNDNLAENGFSTYDTAFTLGGPIIKDQLWFFVSYQEKHRETDVTNAATGALQRTVDDESQLGFAKVTWQPTDNDKLVFSYFNDPRDLSASTNARTPNNRDSARTYGGDNYKFEYSHTFDELIINFKMSSHEGESSVNAADKTTRNDVAYLTGAPLAADMQKGGLGVDEIAFRNKDEYQLTAEYYIDADDFGTHTLKAGYTYTVNENKQNSVYTGSEMTQYTSIGANDIGANLGTYSDSSLWTGSVDITADDFSRIISNIDSSADRGYYMGLLDADGDGAISTTELSASQFNSTAGNPTGDVNAYRIVMTQTAPVTMELKGKSVFIQDSWNLDNLTINAGLRSEKWEHFSSEGDKIASFDWEIAPRLSVVYDINGDGESKVWGFVGRYYDPVRTNMTDFAGNLSGPVRSEQIAIGDKWLEFRSRGGTATQDAFFSPTTKTPYTDQLIIGYARTLAENIGIEVTYTQSETKDIMEDYDLGLYAEDLEGTDYYLPYSYFGYDGNPGSNYVIGTLAGGKREYKGYEVSLKRYKSDNWQAHASYTYNDAKGNTNSDSNADVQGDLLFLDPRAPGQYGDQPGNVKHLFKMYGSYTFENGIEVGAVYNWNSGTLYNKATSVYGRYVPLREEVAYEDGGATTRWLQEGLMGSEVSPSYGILDIRVKYTHDFGNYKGEVFLDINNALDNQATLTEMPLVNGDGTYQFGEATSWEQPRRFYLGARVTF